MALEFPCCMLKSNFENISSSVIVHQLIVEKISFNRFSVLLVRKVTLLYYVGHFDFYVLGKMASLFNKKFYCMRRTLFNNMGCRPLP